ncbi:MAG: hypothetical protein IPM61_16815 [Chlorobi bacterium]|nr:hypothetical protein [Chlorobiota bacterium]
MADNSADFSDVQRGFTAILSGIAPIAKGAIQRGAYRLQPYIVRHMDKAGPPKGVKSTSPRIAIRSGDTVRGLAPNAPNSLFEPETIPNGLAVEYGIDTQKLLYPLFHEFASEFNVSFPERPFFYPGVEDWEGKEVPAMESTLATEIVRLWDQT